MIRFLLTISILALPASSECLADDFQKVAEIFSARCASCHNDADLKGGFSLESAEAFYADGYVEPGDSSSSFLVDLITGDDQDPPAMPKTGPPLSAEEVAVISRWIDAGALWPEGQTIRPKKIDFNWWSFQPLQDPAVPQFEDREAQNWIQSPIDAFILRKLRQKNLHFSTAVDRRTLIRRVTYDLIGLPPTPDEIEAFVNDPSANAYEKLVDRLLASDRYGEHWARHWLDVVKYADTCGYDKDKLRPNAWPYRDYVIRSFNEDKPYARFIKEQIAGDAIYPGTSDGILGLGFIAAGPWDFLGHVEVPESKIDGQVARNLDRDEMVTNTFNTFCSLTIQCARCHDHKFDPFNQTDYYSLQAIFSAVDRAEREYEVDSDLFRKRQRLAAEIRDAEQTIARLNDELSKIAGKRLAELNKKIAELEKRTANQNAEFGYHSEISNSQDNEKWVQVQLEEPKHIDEIILHPCYDDFAGIGAGFGFPVRFRIESENGLIKSFESEDFTNPGAEWVVIPVDEVIGTVRVVATKLAERQNDFIFAMGELELLDKKGVNLAYGAKVTSLDSIEALPRWARENLVDANWYGLNPEEKERLENAKSDVEILKHVSLGEEKFSVLQKSEKRLSELQSSLKDLPKGNVVYAAATEFAVQGNFKPTLGEMRSVHVLHRGNILSRGDQVRPAVLPMSQSGRTSMTHDTTIESQNRAALANWIASHDHPLTWRSIVNRVWQKHFGAGLVTTPNDFGRMGAEPSHPELLDWLATDFRDNGGRFKRLHKMIVMSSVYQQSSNYQSPMANIDSSNQFLWRMNRKRLSAEEIRDSILAVSGKLEPKMGGPGYYLFELEKTEHSPHYEYHKYDHRNEKSFRRSIYRFVVRSQPDPYMTTLDCADSSQSTPTRSETYTPLQSLSLLNNQFNLVQAEHFAERLRGESDDLQQQVRRGFVLATGRDATDEEVKLATEFAEKHGLAGLCRLLFNLNEFVFVD